MKDTLGTLRARIAELGDTWTDEHGTVHERPTAWAYAQACAALDRWKLRAEAAEAALQEIAACPDGVSKTWPEIDTIVRRVVGEEKANAK